MTLSTIDLIHEQLRDAVVDPSAWTVALGTMNGFVNSFGIALLSVDERLKLSPCTDSLDVMMRDYFHSGWHARDAREACLPTLLKSKVVIDDDFQNGDEIERSSYYADFLAKHKQKWFAGVSTFVDDDLWCLAFQRSDAEGRFQQSDLVRLRAVQTAFERSLGLAGKARKTWIAGALFALQSSEEAAFVLDQFATVLHVNENARSLLRAFVNRRGQLALPDKRASVELLNFVNESRDWRVSRGTGMRSIFAQWGGKNFLIEALSLMQEDSLFFHRAVVLVKIKPKPKTIQETLRILYRLTNAELRVAEALSQGLSPPEMSQLFQVSISTIRYQLKSVYYKTETGTQARLLALLLRIQSTSG